LIFFKVKKMDTIDLNTDEFRELSPNKKQLLECVQRIIPNENARLEILEKILNVFKDIKNSNEERITNLILNEQKLIIEKEQLETELFILDEHIVHYIESIRVKDKKIQKYVKYKEFVKNNIEKTPIFIYLLLLFQIFCLYTIFNFP